MVAFFIYLMKWAITLTMLYSLYGLFLSRETFHSLNRMVLLTILVTSMLLPLCSFETERMTFVQKSVARGEAAVASAFEAAMKTLPATAVKHEFGPYVKDTHRSAEDNDVKDTHRSAEDNDVKDTHRGVVDNDVKDTHRAAVGNDVKDTHRAALDNEVTEKPAERERINGTGIVIRLVVWGYLIGLVSCWLRYLLAFGAVMKMIREGRSVAVAGVPSGVKVLVHPGTEMPFSWMHWIVLSRKDMGENLQPILMHELEHVRRGHSWDMLLCELTTRMLWFLPFAWMLRRDLAEVHEYEADRFVLEQGFEETKYQLLLIRKAARAGLQPVVNGFNRSSIKNRLKMMYKKKSSRAAALKVLYLLPLIAFAVTAFARPTMVEELQRTLERESERGPLLSLPKPGAEEGAMASGTTPAAEEMSFEPTTPPEGGGDVSHPTGGDTLETSTGVDTCLMTIEPNPEMLLDSTMAAIGARKIGRGVYVGAFRPNYTGDTIRVKHVQIDGGAHWEIDGCEEGYTIWLQKEDREELGRGYHIRTMQPAQQAKTPHVNNAPIDPHWRPAEVTRHEADAQSMRLERGKDETRLNVYMTTEMPNPEDGTLDMLGVDFAELALIDPKTGDRYMCRRVENYEDKFVALSIGDKAGVVVKITAIYPPLPKKVRRVELAIHTPNGWERTGTVFKLKKDERPVQVIH